MPTTEDVNRVAQNYRLPLKALAHQVAHHINQAEGWLAGAPIEMEGPRFMVVAFPSGHTPFQINLYLRDGAGSHQPGFVAFALSGVDQHASLPVLHRSTSPMSPADQPAAVREAWKAFLEMSRPESVLGALALVSRARETSSPLHPTSEAESENSASPPVTGNKPAP